MERPASALYKDICRLLYNMLQMLLAVYRSYFTVIYCHILYSNILLIIMFDSVVSLVLFDKQHNETLSAQTFY